MRNLIGERVPSEPSVFSVTSVATSSFFYCFPPHNYRTKRTKLPE